MAASSAAATEFMMRKSHRDEFVSYSTRHKLDGTTCTLVWLVLSLDLIDRKHAST